MGDTFKLTYFNLRARAEPIRYIFAMAGVPYEDCRIKNEDWPEVKKTLPFGQLPVLEVNGKQLAQSHTIARFLARKFKLVGADEFEAAQCDENTDAISDLNTERIKLMYEKDETKKAELLKTFTETTLPKYFGKFSKCIERNGGQRLVGSGITWADLALAIMVDNLVLRFPELGVEAEYPYLAQLRDHVNSLPQIKKWIQTRPVTDA